MKFLIILVMAFVLLIPANSFALSGSSTEFGSLNIDNTSVSVSEADLTIINISGTAVNYYSGQSIIIQITKLGNPTIEIKTRADNDGVFSTPLIVDSNWEVGNYQLLATYLGDEIGSASFEITSVSVKNIPVFTNIGSFEIDNEKITITGNTKSTVEVNGNLYDYTKGEHITLSITHPDGVISEVIITGQRSGEFTAHISIEDSWESGDFSIIASYDEKDFGQVNFQLNIIQIPNWFKNTAKWYGAGFIPDETYFDTIDYLIDKEFIDIGNLTPEHNVKKHDYNFSWLADESRYWADGQIPDKDFVLVFKNLIEYGLVRP